MLKSSLLNLPAVLPVVLPVVLRGRRAAAAFSIGIALLLLPSIWGSARAGEEVTVDGVVHVRNEATPSKGVETRQLEELWRAGGEDDEVFFGTIGQVLSDEKGNIYLMDGQLSEVQVYSPDGEHLRTLGREGDGPGEVRNPSDVFFTPDGKLGMAQTFPGKVVKVDLSGTPAGSFALGSADPSQGTFNVLIQGRSGGGILVLAGIRMTWEPQGISKQTYFLSQCDSMGREVKRYLSKEHALDYTDFALDEQSLDFAWGRFDVAADGKLYAAPHRNRYEIHVFATDGQLLRVIERKYASWTRKEEQKREARLTIEAVGRNYPAEPREITVEETEADIMTLRVAADGTLWVRNSRGVREPPEGVLTSYDLFDTSGHFQKQVNLAAPGDAARDAVHLLGEDRVVVVARALDAFLSQQGISSEDEEEDEAAPLEVICYAMAK